jgi:PIN domain nuclease of toxin-antitoxin system
VIALLDTHVLVWWFEKPSRLTTAQRGTLRRAGDARSLGVCDITLLEIAQLVERGRVRLALPLDEWLSRATAAPLVDRVGISPAIAREVADLQVTRDWDPADRVIVASARVLGVPLATSDERIVGSGLVRTI